MHRTTRSALGARTVLFLTLALVAAPGCELATHFGDYSSGGGSDMGGVDGGDSDGGDGGARDAGDAGDARIDVGPLPDGGDGGSMPDTGVPTHHVTVNIDGTGVGTLTAMGGMLTCATTTGGTSMSCGWDVPDGTALVIHGEGDTLSTLSAWSGSCGPTAVPGDCNVTVHGDITLGATFNLRRVTLTVTVANPPGTVDATAPAGVTLHCDGTAGTTATCHATVDAGTVVSLSAAPSLPNTQVAWGGVMGCTGTTCDVTVNADMTVTATFSDGRPVLNVNITGHGTVATADMLINCRSGMGTCSNIYSPSTTVTLTATPDAGWSLTGWTGCDSNPSPNQCVVSLPAMSMHTVAATFTINTYGLTVNVTGTANGTVSSSSPALTCTSADGTCMVSAVNYGTSVTLTATPDPTARFQSWSGVPGCSTSTTCTFTLTADTNVTATFVPDTRDITVAIAGADGQIVSSTAPFNCTYSGGMPTAGSVCRATLNVGATFDLTVVPHTGYRVSSTGWVSSPAAIGCSGTGTSCMGTTVRAIAAGGGTVTVNLTPINYTLDVVATAPTGGGSVTITSGAGSSMCTATAAGMDCPASYPYGTMVTLHGAPNAGSVFLGWGGGTCSGTADCVVTIDAAKTVNANFAIMTSLLQVNTSGTSTGTVNSITGSGMGTGVIACGGTCSAMLAPGTMITLRASPAANYVFSGWSGACSGTGDCIITIGTGASIVTATFTLVQEPLTITISGGGSGQVVDGGGTTCATGTCMANYSYGTMVMLTATPGANSVFGGWGGACAGVMGSTCTVNMIMAQTVTAQFNPARGTLSVLESGTGSGNVTSMPPGIVCNQPGIATDVCTTSFNLPATITLAASPALHSHVTAWSGCTSVSADLSTCTVTLGATTSVTVQFDLDTFVVNANPTPPSLGSVRSSDLRINCGASCGATYSYGSTVTLTANPTAPNLFTGWSGVPGCTTNPLCTFTVTSGVTATANFAAPRTLTVSLPANSTAAGSRVFLPGGTTCTVQASSATTCNVSLASGTMVTLNSDPRPRWEGAIWSGVAGCSGPRCSFPLNADTTVTVTWAQTGNIAFVTSMSYALPFGGTGPAALTQANTWCQNRAAAAGLPGSASYIAWLSNSSTSVASRVPSGDQIWIRTDGQPIATTRTQLLSGAIINPWILDENGATVVGSAWTGSTYYGGVITGSNCNEWTAAGGSGRTGNTTSTGNAWTDTGGSVGCSGTQHLYCMQTNGTGFATLGSNPPSDAVYIFTSTHTGSGAYTVTQMDRDCQSEATAASLPGTYAALVSTTTTTAWSRAAMYGTLTRADGWIVGPHNSTTSVLWLAQGVGTFAVHANGSVMSTAAAATWNGMGANSTGFGATCSDWTSGGSTSSGATGDGTSALVSNWSGYSNTFCNTVQPWYCIQTGP